MFLISGFTAYRNVKFILKPILWRLSDRAVATASWTSRLPPTPQPPTPTRELMWSAGQMRHGVGAQQGLCCGHHGSVHRHLVHPGCVCAHVFNLGLCVFWATPSISRVATSCVLCRVLLSLECETLVKGRFAHALFSNVHCGPAAHPVRCIY